MADVPQTSALIVIAQNYAGGIVRQINRTATLLKLLAPTFRQGEGSNVAWVAEGDGAIAEAFAEGATPANFGSDKQTGALLPFARYWATFHVTGSAMAAAATSRTPAGNIELWARNMMNGAEKLAKTLDVDLYTGASGGNTFVGLDEAIGDDANTYATIDRTVGANAFWKPTVSDSASAPISFAQIRSDLAAIKVASGYKPDLAMVSPATYNKIASLYDPQKMYVYQTVDRVMSAGQEIVLDGGVGAIKFDGCYFVEDSFCPDNKIYYLNSLYIRVEHQDAAASLAMGIGDEAMVLGGLSDGFDTIPLGIVMELLAKTGDAQKAMMKCYPQLCVARPNAFGVRKNIG